MRRRATRTVAAIALALGLAGVAVAPPAAAAVSFKNCTELQKTYKNGVGRANATDKVKGRAKPVTTWKRDTAVYNRAIKANGRLDADRDGVACEKR